MKVLVTGSSKGIGRSIATKFLDMGHSVIGFDILDSTIDNKNYKHYVQDICNDLPDINDIEIIINNAGVQNADISDIDSLEEILNFLNGLDSSYLLEDHGYEDICILVREFWHHSTYRNSVEENIVVGNIDKVVDDFDSIMGKGAFENVSLILDNIYHLPEDVSDKEFNKQIDSFVSYSKEYRERVKDLEKTK